MMPDYVAEFIEWWSSMSTEERRMRLDQARERRAYWRTRRAEVLFGILESDSAFDILETGHFKLEDGMGNMIAYADEWATEARAEGSADWKHIAESVQDRATAQHPTYLGMITSVKYNERSDRYVVHFGDSSAKITVEVAEFLLTEVFSSRRPHRPTVYAHMAEGVIDSVLLLYLSR